MKERKGLSISIALSLIISLTLTNKYFVADSDTLNSVIVWHEIQLHGLSIMNQWTPTPDNWYFSVYPIHFLFFSLFGSGSNVIILISFIQVFLCALLSSLLIRNISGNYYSIYLMPALSCLSYFAYETGYVYHPLSHNITNLYGLLCLYIITTANEKNTTKGIAVAALSLVASISDPWYVVAYGLPFILGSIYIFIKNKKLNITFIYLQVLYLIIFFSHIVQNKLGIPVARFQFVSIDEFWLNLNWYFYGLGGLLNILIHDSKLAKTISAILLVLLVCYTVMKNWKANEFFIILMLSIAGVSSSFIVGYPLKEEYSARFLINICYLIPIILTVTLSCKWEKSPIIIASAMLILLGSTHLYQREVNHSFSNEQLLDFLKDNDLKFGYGAYWSSRSTAITYLSNWKNVIRPMRINEQSGELMLDQYHAQVFKKLVW